MGTHARGAGGRQPLRPITVVAGVLVVAAAAAVVVLVVVLSSRPSTTSSPAPSSETTPLGCPAPLPALPTMVGEPELACTEHALIARACDLDPDAMTPSVVSTPVNRIVTYQGDAWWYKAFIQYNPSLPDALVRVTCSIPAGGHSKRGNAALSPADWRMIAAAGTALPDALQPARLLVSTAASPSSSPAPPTTYARDPAADATAEDCSHRATDVFTRLARHQITLAQAREQLPPKVPASALDSGLNGVQNYEHDGLSPADAINESAGAVAQNCEY